MLQKVFILLLTASGFYASEIVNYELAVNEIVKSFTTDHHGYNLVTITESFKAEIEAFCSKILKNNSDQITAFVHHENFVTSLKLNTLVIIDSSNDFMEKFNQTLSERFDFKLQFIIVVVNGTLDDVRSIFQFFWHMKIINVKACLQVNGSVLLLSYSPFTNTSCDDCSPIVNNRFIGKSFEKKISGSLKFNLNNLKNCSISSATFDTPPNVMMEKTKDGIEMLGGSEVMLIKTLAASLNFDVKIEILPDSSGKWGKVFKNGTATGATKVILDGKADIIFGNYLLKLSRLTVTDSSIAYVSSPLVFVVPHGSESNAFKKLFRAFETSVWLLFLFSVFVVFVILFIINNQSLEIRLFIFGKNMRIPYLNVVSTILGVGDRVESVRNVSRFFWILFTIVCLVLR